tara:strand:- start:657 stop:1589 length:933 start_codon:yes stop_codon:yes gene_type:complete
MEQLKCIFCNYISKTKYNYIRHLKTKKHLKNVEKSKEILCGISIAPKIEHKMNTNEHKTSKIEHKMNTKEHKMNTNAHFAPFCEYCGKIFKSLPSLNRHIKQYCKVKKEIDEEKENDKKEIEELKSQVNRLIDKVGNKVNLTYNTKVNKNNTLEISNSNTSFTSQVQYIENQNIQLNNFGKENLEMLTDEVKTQMIKGPYRMFPKMMELIYFNDKFPENKNIKLLNRKDDVLQIYDKEKGWKFVDKHETINDFLEDKSFEIDSYYDKNDINFNKFAKKTYQRFRELYESDDKMIWNRIIKQIDLVLWNNM